MKKLIFAAVLFCIAMNVQAYGVAFLQSCTFGYNADYGVSGYTGIYRHQSGNIYRYFFPMTDYSYCPQQIKF